MQLLLPFAVPLRLLDLSNGVLASRTILLCTLGSALEGRSKTPHALDKIERMAAALSDALGAPTTGTAGGSAAAAAAASSAAGSDAAPWGTAWDGKYVDGPDGWSAATLFGRSPSTGYTYDDIIFLPGEYVLRYSLTGSLVAAGSSSVPFLVAEASAAWQLPSARARFVPVARLAAPPPAPRRVNEAAKRAFVVSDRSLGAPTQGSGHGTLFPSSCA